MQGLTTHDTRCTTSSQKCIANFLNLRNFETKRDTTKKAQINKSLEDLTILFRAFLTYIFPFQSYGGSKKMERAILF